MIAVGEDDLICDMAETYGVYEMRSLRPSVLAVLACGLPPESRVMRRMSGRKDDIDIQTLLLARAVDYLALLVWSRTEDGMKGRNQPASIVDSLLHRDEKKENEHIVYDSPEDFERAWKRAGGK